MITKTYSKMNFLGFIFVMFKNTKIKFNNLTVLSKIAQKKFFKEVETSLKCQSRLSAEERAHLLPCKLQYSQAKLQNKTHLYLLNSLTYFFDPEGVSATAFHVFFQFTNKSLER